MKRTTMLLLTLLLAASAIAVEPVNAIALKNVAIKGYDPVAYFADAKAIEGSEDFELTWRNAAWRFASAAHRDEFEKNPEKYAPQYGGYCAFGVSRGYAVDVDPEAWHVVDGKLYLNYNKDVQTEWRKDVAGYVKKADENWPKILDK